MDQEQTGASACEWHALPLHDVAARLNTDMRGLNAGEAGARLARYGPNNLPAPPAKPAWRVFAAQFRNLLIIILLVAAVASVFLGSVVEAVAIILIVVLASALGFVQEYRAERAIDALREMSAPNAIVLRDGIGQTVNSRDLVPGDIIIVQPGQRIAADARILQQFNLRADESPLTGESMPVDKSADAVCATDAAVADRGNMVYSGSTVARGRGRARVLAIARAREADEDFVFLGLAGMMDPPRAETAAAIERCRAAGIRAVMITVTIRTRPGP